MRKILARQPLLNRRATARRRFFITARGARPRTIAWPLLRFLTFVQPLFLATTPCHGVNGIGHGGATNFLKQTCWSSLFRTTSSNISFQMPMQTSLVQSHGQHLTAAFCLPCQLTLTILRRLSKTTLDIIARGSQRKRQICQTVCNNCFSSTNSNSKTFRTLYRSWTLTFFNAFMFQKDLLPPHDLIACLRRSLPPAGSSLTNCYPRGLFAPLRHPSRHLF